MATASLARRLAIPRAVAQLRPKTRRRSPAISSSLPSTDPAPTTTIPSANPECTERGIKSNPTIKPSAALVIAGASLLGGYCLGSSHSEHWAKLQENRELPSGERGCCSCDAGAADDDGGATADGPSNVVAMELAEARAALPSKLTKIVGRDHVIDGTKGGGECAPYLRGARLGDGGALCIVRPGTLGEAVRCLREIVDAECVVLPQGSNTGLTGGSVPRNDTPDTRPAVVLSMKRLDAHFPIDNGDRVVCLAGCGLSTLASSVQSWFPDRESHSVLGSTFLNPTTAAGVAFGSGGVYMRKGPARTDRALYCRVSRSKWGENVVTVVNTLGVRGLEDSDFREHSGDDAVGALDAYANDVRRGFRRAMAESSRSIHGRARSSDTGYADAVCKCTKRVSRYNADTSGEDCNRSEGKVMILATVHDTFPVPKKKRVFWVSFPDLETTLAFRREVCLNNPEDMPISCEYLDRDSVDIIDRSGRICAHLIRYLGMGDIMGVLWDIKVRISSLPFSWAPLLTDKLLYNLNDWVPEAIPKKFMAAGRQWDHHCLVAVGEYGGGTLDRFMERMNKFVKKQNEKIEKGGKIVYVTEAESISDIDSLNAFRYVAALAFKTYCIGEDIQGISLDYALPLNGGLLPPLPASAAKPLKRMRYSHLGCNVVHEDVAYALGVDTHKEKMLLKHVVEEQGGNYQQSKYHAPIATQKRWMTMDPLNVLNPGIGGLSALPKYGK